MLKITKEADYALLIVKVLSRAPQQLSANEITQLCHISAAMVSKILKLLTKANILRSTRGTKGGYILNTSLANISVAHILQAIEGPLVVNECVNTDHQCHREAYCGMAPQWAKINHAIHMLLDSIMLTELDRELPSEFVLQRQHPSPQQNDLAIVKRPEITAKLPVNSAHENS